jgi:hypothetical protein
LCHTGRCLLAELRSQQPTAFPDWSWVGWKEGVRFDLACEQIVWKGKVPLLTEFLKVLIGSLLNQQILTAKSKHIHCKIRAFKSWMIHQSQVYPFCVAKLRRMERQTYMLSTRLRKSFPPRILYVTNLSNPCPSGPQHCWYRSPGCQSPKTSQILLVPIATIRTMIL